jgi:hypothetical protein
LALTNVRPLTSTCYNYYFCKCYQCNTRDNSTGIPIACYVSFHASKFPCRFSRFPFSLTFYCPTHRGRSLTPSTMHSTHK